jgi:hypothetical protein
VSLHDQCLAQNMYSGCRAALYGCTHVLANSTAIVGIYYQGLYNVTCHEHGQRVPSNLTCMSQCFHLSQ